ncbi:D-alpha,beta-D-heptose 7-phosphate 1-kinase; D-beta-D-heptose 1-phosphate adenylyltransferase [Isosphaera pallida ATCC 43644]|uniref:Bifunctional protein HldE n=1 Tax=Isosphaera pallida (strain ATCC 43644 / DSM 9630 / IS1B) TaxID=575540 RepID=E8R1C2_ISOPI|nr:D-glycero-beta-D-manno-heptose 1-phosphate adenylyltransferase [Isosphaera pallida]ADV62339.1 D-alpha,beta-D-heptose 7-phosphate 1-kinase; D-beta-D-heptose 1-phosphate adenylyltransferase [Isosphaera pallida ATCC 43644]
MEAPGSWSLHHPDLKAGRAGCRWRFGPKRSIEQGHFKRDAKPSGRTRRFRYPQTRLGNDADQGRSPRPRRIADDGSPPPSSPHDPAHKPHSAPVPVFAAHDLIRRVEGLGRPRILVLGDLILDRYIWGRAERISQEAPVPLLRADAREHRLGGAASVAAMLAALGAEVGLMAGVGNDAEARVVRDLLSASGVRDDHLVELDDRPTTLKERYIGRAQDRHPQQMIRVDYEVRDPITQDALTRLLDQLDSAVAWADLALISDYDKGVCTPELLRALIERCRAAGIKVVADPIRSDDYAKYRGVHCMTPNRLEAQLATGMSIRTPEDALEVGRRLVETLEMEAALVTLDRDGIAVVHADGRRAVLPTRPRQVYDITGAGDMVLAMVGLCLAEGADYDEAAALGNVAGGLEVERIGVATLTREDILRDLWEHCPRASAKRPELPTLLREIERRRTSGQTIVFTNGCFDLLHVGHVRLLRQARALGDFLVVGLNSDLSVKRLKGPSRPILSERDRAEVLAALECVDAVVVFEEDTPLNLIESIQPDVLVKGGDYTLGQVVGRDVVEARGGRVELVPLVPGHSTTGMVRRLDTGTSPTSAVSASASALILGASSSASATPSAAPTTEPHRIDSPLIAHTPESSPPSPKAGRMTPKRVHQAD